MNKNIAAAFIHDLVKIKFVNEGYLPNYPYHLISDKEMCDAFLLVERDEKGNINKSGYFYDAYPCLISEYSGDTNEYSNLERSIRYHLYKLKSDTDSEYTLPDWVYSYMLGKVISIFSDKSDIHDLIKPMGVDNIDDEFTAEASKMCFQISELWLKQTRANYSLSGGDDRYVMFEGLKTDLRPPTMFGEPHVIKSIRLGALSPSDWK